MSEEMALRRRFRFCRDCANGKGVSFVSLFDSSELPRMPASLHGRNTACAESGVGRGMSEREANAWATGTTDDLFVDSTVEGDGVETEPSCVAGNDSADDGRSVVSSRLWGWSCVVGR